MTPGNIMRLSPRLSSVLCKHTRRQQSQHVQVNNRNCISRWLSSSSSGSGGSRSLLHYYDNYLSPLPSSDVRSLSSSSTSASSSQIRRRFGYHDDDNGDNHYHCSRRHYSSSTILLHSAKKEYPPHTLFPMPALSPTMDMGSISQWHKKEGDAFTAGEVLCTIDTDKASVDFEAQDDGILAKILVPAAAKDAAAAASDILIGVPICVVVDDAGDVAAFSDYAVETTTGDATSSPSSVSVGASTAAAAVVAPAPPPSTLPSGPSILMPSARHLSQSKGFDATVLRGTGKGGRVTKADVLHALQQGVGSSAASTTAAASTSAAPSAGASTPPPPLPSASSASFPPPAASATIAATIPVIETTGSFEDLPNNKMRKIIASRLTESKRDVPHFYTSTEVELDAILALRKKLATKHNVKVSVNDFIIRCCALSLRDVPEVNASYHPPTQSVRWKEPQAIDISVAVATPTGLITPIVFQADQLGLAEITEKVRDLATRARLGKLAPHEYQGGSFSISNLGMFGIDEFSAVINPPQAAILAVGGGSRRVVASRPFVDDAVKEHAVAASKAPETSQPPRPWIRTIMTARLSADRRVVDEATAALFMSAFRHYVNEPQLLLL